MASWKNWAETIKHNDLKHKYKPDNLSDLKSDIKDAAKKGLMLRAVGAGHAWSNLGLPGQRQGAIIEMKRLKKVLGQKGNIVEVEAGITIENLNKWLFKNNLALENFGDADPQNIAGAVSTETHGSGAGLGSISEFVEGMKIVKADGELHDLTQAELKAGRVSVGKLGAIYSVSLRVRESYFLHHQQELVKFSKQDEGGNIDKLLKNRHLEYWYYPYTGMAERIVRNEVDSTKVINELDIFEEWFIKASTDIIELMGIVSPQKLPGLLINNVKANKPGFRPFVRQGPWHKMLLGKSNVWRRVVKTYTMEYQFDFKHLWEAFGQLEASIELARKKRVFIASPIQIRFTKKSERSLLSHMSFEPTVSFSISFFRKHKGVHTWFPELEKRLLDLGGKPHRGKMYYTQPVENPEFEKIRKNLDPSGVFSFEQGPYNPDPEAFSDH
jgi:L-gulono-1,4-lactone dehydrogenase